MVDSVYRTRSLGVAAVGLPDQYADGKAAKVWQLYIGDTRSRTAEYKSWVLALLKKHGCQRVLDVACGTGVDSIMLVEEGFTVMSVDASDKMLKHALKARWERRKEELFDKWVIEEANWLTLLKDVQKPGTGFDAVICLGNSFSHLPDFKGDQSDQQLALQNIASMVKPGGILIIDHRNYDHMLKTGRAPPGKNIYYKSDLTQDITTSVLLVDSKPHMITLDYTVQVPPEQSQDGCPELSKFRLSYYPHQVDDFKELLRNAFQGKCEQSVHGDFKSYTPGQDTVPCYFIHVAWLFVILSAVIDFVLLNLGQKPVNPHPEVGTQVNLPYDPVPFPCTLRLAGARPQHQAPVHRDSIASRVVSETSSFPRGGGTKGRNSANDSFGGKVLVIPTPPLCLLPLPSPVKRELRGDSQEHGQTKQALDQCAPVDRSEWAQKKHGEIRNGLVNCRAEGHPQRKGEFEKIRDRHSSSARVQRFEVKSLDVPGPQRDREKTNSSMSRMKSSPGIKDYSQRSLARKTTHLGGRKPPVVPSERWPPLWAY
ncbi:GNMT methyltransferase, partial [Polyodon spathula]|nr:GNMT methyltransferase [Polyodon spathula]